VTGTAEHDQVDPAGFSSLGAMRAGGTRVREDAC
jgi:hypothetical protein